VPKPISDRGAVSPVIGVILLVAITVVLASTLLALVSGIIDLDSFEEEERGFPEPDEPPSFPPIFRSGGLTEDPQAVFTGKNLELSRGTVITWLKLDSGSIDGGVVIKGVASENDIDQSYGIRMDSGGLRPEAFIAMDGAEDDIVFHSAASTPVLNIGQWYMLVASFSANKIEMNVYSVSSHLPTYTASVTPPGDLGSFAPRSSAGQPVMVLAQGVDPLWMPLDGSVFDWRIYGYVMSKADMDSVWMETRNELPS